MFSLARKRSGNYHRKAVCVITALLVYLCLKYFDEIKIYHKQLWKFTITSVQSTDNIFKQKRKILDAKLQFLSDWNQLVISRLNFTRIFGNCDMTWRKKVAVPWHKKPERTDHDKSYFSVWNINPAGEFSRIVLQTQYPNDTLKHQGGDYWRVFVRGVTSLPIVKTDLGDGSYEFKFLPMVDGFYQLSVTLEYTLCDGIKQPPPDWFINGNVQGKEQKHGILYQDVPYINRSLWSMPNIQFYVPASRLSQKDQKMLLEEGCEMERRKCKYTWNGFGSWLNKTVWQPLCSDFSRPRYPRNREGVLWIFGDSVSSQFYHQIKHNRICKKIFRNCMYTYNWVYSLENYNLTLGKYVRRNSTMEKKLWDDRDFNVTKSIEELKQAVLNPSMGEKSVILLNYGLHFTEATNFSNFKELIASVVKLKDQVKCKFLWRTTTSLNRHKYSMPNLHSRRFMTSQRVQLYNGYATAEFCKADVDVLDIYPLTDSYPFGTGNHRSPTDPVHYEYHVMKPMEMLLERMFGE